MVSRTIAIELSDETASALEQAARDEGMPVGALIARALKRDLFVRQFRRLRAETLAHLRTTGEGELTDEEVFRMIS